MKINYYTYVTKAEITLTRKELEVIKKCSEAHYDGVCKSISREGGFIYGWFNKLGVKNSITETVTFNTCDIIAKTLEVQRYMPKEDIEFAYKLSIFFHDIMKNFTDDTENMRTIHQYFSKPFFKTFPVLDAEELLKLNMRIEMHNELQ